MKRMIWHTRVCMIFIWESAHAEDGMIADLWNYIQSTPQYKNKTTLIITSDHGRGDNPKENWKDHGEKIKDAGHIWIAAIGPDTQPGGEMKNKNVLYQEQLADNLCISAGFYFYCKPSNS